MKVSELIEKLKAMPQDAEVRHLWDGAARTEIKHVWLTREGVVVTADDGEACYNTPDRPADAPTVEQDRYWRTPSPPDEES